MAMRYWSRGPKKNALKTMSDFGAWVAQAATVKLAASPNLVGPPRCSRHATISMLS